MAKKEPLYPHTPKRKGPLYPHVPKGLPTPKDTIFFNVPEAREHLISKGFVYTLRPRMRRTGYDTAYTGSYYKKERIADVQVEFVKEVWRPDDLDLKEYLSGSGFKTVDDWWKAAKGSPFLFKVTKLPEVVDNIEVFTSEELSAEVARGAGLHRDPKVEYRYTTVYTGPDLYYFEKDLKKLLRERIGNPNLAADAYYIRPSTSPSMEFLAKTEGDPISKYCCSQCGECAPEELLEEGRFLDRISWLRRHYKDKHPGMWGKMSPMTVEGGELVPPQYHHLAGLVSEPLPKDAY